MGERGRMLTLSSYKHPLYKENAQPPSTLEEFLDLFNLDDWPKVPYMTDMNPQLLVSQIKNDYPVDTVEKYLHEKAPMPYEIISKLEKRIEECKLQVQEHAKHVLTLESEKPETDQLAKQVDVTSSPESQDTSKKKMKIELKFPTEAAEETSGRELESFSFPGFSLWKLTKLPNNLEAAHLWDMVVKVQIFKAVNTKLLKQLFFSEASLAILQDCFWWWFLHKFQPNQDEEDHFFDRISDSYVTLLWSIPKYIKDNFLQMYPECLSHAIYVTFCEAFPNSWHRFDDQFKDELTDLIFQWIRGFKPQRFAWKNWKCPSMEKHKKITAEDISSQTSLYFVQPKSRTASGSSSRSSSKLRTKTLRFQVSDLEHVQEPAEEKQESHYIGDGPDFQHSLFNLGGQSPLVYYYFQLHGIPNILANSRGYRINHSEICKVPPISPTYRDVIQKSLKASKKLLDKFYDFEHKCYAELVTLQEKRAKTDRKFRRMQKCITTKPTEKRIKIEKFLLQVANAKIHRHASSESQPGAKDV